MGKLSTEQHRTTRGISIQCMAELSQPFRHYVTGYTFLQSYRVCLLTRLGQIKVYMTVGQGKRKKGSGFGGDSNTDADPGIF